jgi:ATP-dependent 26S proteasome regulatory subunit
LEKIGLREYLQAGCPLIHLQTIEYLAAVQHIVETFQTLPSIEECGYNLAIWKVISGMRTMDLSAWPDGKWSNPSNCQEPLDAIEWVQKTSSDKNPILAIFHNVRFYVEQSAPIIQALIDTAYKAKEEGSHIILLGPSFNLPVELNNLVTRVVYPLPTQAELAEIFKRISLKYGKKLEMPDGSNWGEAFKENTDKYGNPEGYEITKEQEAILQQAARHSLGLDSFTAENAFCLAIAATQTIDLDIIQAQKEAEVRKSDVLEFVTNMEDMDAVGGMDAFKSWLKKREGAFSEEARKYGLPYPKGILLAGLSGTGKSLAAKAIAHYLGLPLLRLDIGKVFQSLVGASEANIRLALQVAETVSPCVMWVDELERGLAGARGSGELDSGVTARVVGTLLTWRAETTAPVLLVATANDITSLPSMIYRKGRFDEVWAVDLPNTRERAEIFSIHLKKRGRDPEKFSIENFANKTEGWVGAEIEAVVEEAMFSAFADSGREPTDQDIYQGIEETKCQSDRDPEETETIREWIESHARNVSTGIDTSDNGFGEKKVRQLRIEKKKGGKPSGKTKDKDSEE